MAGWHSYIVGTPATNNAHVECPTQLLNRMFHVDTFELYQSRTFLLTLSMEIVQAPGAPYPCVYSLFALKSLN